MRNILKVAKWEIKRNMKNKSFVIGLFITPLIFALFMIIPNLFNDSEPETVDVYLTDEVQVTDAMNDVVKSNDMLNWEIHETDLAEDAILNQLQDAENMAYVPLTEDALNEGTIPVYLSDDLGDEFMNQISFLEEPLQQVQLEKYGFSSEELALINQKVTFEEGESKEAPGEAAAEEESASVDPLERLIPGGFAGIVLFSIVISGMMIFQSASQEKKDKIAEIILSSLTPNELMQGKVIGYFVLGIIQVGVWLALLLPVIMWQVDVPILEYLFVPELAVLLAIAVLGYLLFASLFVGIGATIEDVSTSSNFQGLVIMLPFLPFVFVGPILTDPNGVIAKVMSFVPITSPSIMLIRLSTLDEWPWMEIIISIVILILSVWLFMKLAGKIFKTGILLYGKNATPKEIWKWMWQ